MTAQEAAQAARTVNGFELLRDRILESIQQEVKRGGRKLQTYAFTAAEKSQLHMVAEWLRGQGYTVKLPWFTRPFSEIRIYW